MSIGPKQMLLERMWRDRDPDAPDLAAAVRAELEAGGSWRTVADFVSEATGLRVSHEALRQWYGQKEAATP